MATEKILNTRIQLKYDTLENWNKSTFKLKAGELAVVTLGENKDNSSVGTANQHPVLFKVGTGNHTFAELPFASALAADVYSWAKAENKPEYQASEIKGLDEYIAGEIQDTNTDTQYRFSTEGDKLVVHKTLYTLGVAGTEEKVGEYEFLTAEEVKAMIPDITASGDNEITLTANKHNVTAAHATHAAGSAKTASTASISGYGATGSIKVPKIVTNAAGHVTEISEETVSITMPGAQDLSNYKTKQTVVSDPTANGNATAFIDSISQNENGEIVVTKKNITAADLGLSNAMHFVGAFTEAPASPAAGDVYLNTATHKEYVYDETNGWVELGDEGSHALKTISITGTDGLTGGGTLESNREIKLSDATKASLSLADNSKQKQTAVVSKFTAPAHVISSLSQNENGDIAYEVKELAPADIGAQPAGDYATKTEMSNQDAAILAEAQKYADSLNHEDTKYAAAVDGGLKLNENNEFAIDDSVTFVFHCGSATELI